MDSIIVRGHQSLTKLAEFGPTSGTFHRVNGREGLIFAHGGKFYGIPEIDIEQEIRESLAEDSEAAAADQGDDSASAGSDSLPLARKKK